MFHQCILRNELTKIAEFPTFVGFFNNYSVQPLPMQRLQNTAHSEGWHGKKKKKNLCRVTACVQIICSGSRW